jgi:hypothetical protein
MDDFFGYGLYPGGYVEDKMDYVNPTQKMRDFYDEWWEQPPTLGALNFKHI